MEHCGLLFNEHGSWFWASLPSKTFLLALAADALAGTLLTFVGLPGLKPLPWWQTVAELGRLVLPEDWERAATAFELDLSDRRGVLFVIGVVRWNQPSLGMAIRGALPRVDGVGEKICRPLVGV